jgi:hypothetical protein
MLGGIITLETQEGIGSTFQASLPEIEETETNL